MRAITRYGNMMYYKWIIMYVKLLILRQIFNIYSFSQDNDQFQKGIYILH